MHEKKHPQGTLSGVRASTLAVIKHTHRQTLQTSVPSVTNKCPKPNPGFGKQADTQADRQTNSSGGDRGVPRATSASPRCYVL